MDIGEVFRNMYLIGIRRVPVPFPTTIAIVKHLQTECPSILEAWGLTSSMDLYGQMWYGVKIERPD